MNMHFFITRNESGNHAIFAELGEGEKQKCVCIHDEIKSAKTAKRLKDDACRVALFCGMIVSG